jgi:hypothetical protein
VLPLDDAELEAYVDEVAAEVADGARVVLLAHDGDRRSSGWVEVGVVPRYAAPPHGPLAATTFFFKELAG